MCVVCVCVWYVSVCVVRVCVWYVCVVCVCGMYVCVLCVCVCGCGMCTRLGGSSGYPLPQRLMNPLFTVKCFETDFHLMTIKILDTIYCHL